VDVYRILNLSHAYYSAQKRLYRTQPGERIVYRRHPRPESGQSPLQAKIAADTLFSGPEVDTGDTKHISGNAIKKGLKQLAAATAQETSAGYFSEDKVNDLAEKVMRRLERMLKTESRRFGKLQKRGMHV